MADAAVTSDSATVGNGSLIAGDCPVCGPGGYDGSLELFIVNAPKSKPGNGAELEADALEEPEPEEYERFEEISGFRILLNDDALRRDGIAVGLVDGTGPVGRIPGATAAASSATNV